jgi:hypothetical protein
MAPGRASTAVAELRSRQERMESHGWADIPAGRHAPSGTILAQDRWHPSPVAVGSLVPKTAALCQTLRLPRLPVVGAGEWCRRRTRAASAHTPSAYCNNCRGQCGNSLRPIKETPYFSARSRVVRANVSALVSTNSRAEAP